MPTRSYNHLVIDLNKAAFAWHFWRNQHGEVLRTKPKGVTAHCIPFNPDETIKYWCMNSESWKTETLLVRAMKCQSLDHWTPVTRFRMTCSDTLEFTGDKAQSLWKAWNEKQFKKK